MINFPQRSWTDYGGEVMPTLLNIEAGQGQVTPPLDGLSGLKTYYIWDN